MSSTQPPNTPNPEDEEVPINVEAEERITFPEGYYRHTPTGEIRRASVDGARVIWFEATFDTFIGVEIRSKASSRRLLGDLAFLPGYSPS